MIENDPLAPYVRSYMPGRIRLRHPALKSPEAASALNEFLGKMEGVTALEINPKVGSLLLYWDPEKLDIESLKAMAVMMLPKEEQPAAEDEKKTCPLAALNPLHSTKAVNQFVNRSMTATFLLMLSGLVPGLRLGRQVHIAAGAAFAALAAWHMARYRKTLV